jgi:hypothetical protein
MLAHNLRDSESTEVSNLLLDIVNEVEMSWSKCKLCQKTNVETFENITPRARICTDCYDSRKYLDLFALQAKNIRKMKDKNNQVKKDDDTNSQQSDDANADSRRITRNSIKQQKQQQNHAKNEMFENRTVKNRRNYFFKQTAPRKCESLTSSSRLIIDKDFVFYKGVYYRIGDIMALVDETTARSYYAQIHSFLSDQHAKKYAIITWLLPLDSDITGEFNESQFVLGPTEEHPRLLDNMQFVTRPKLDRFRQKQILDASRNGLNSSNPCQKNRNKIDH